ncbi:hypothetical protein ABEB36_013784 [Hypothenemus hampei]|uniref:Homeobox domain-containing protein n=1 Tax=Hypothenemus hampei TaxID=57062 RepID=A0ABD1E589_HYPHA
MYAPCGIACLYGITTDNNNSLYYSLHKSKFLLNFLLASTLHEKLAIVFLSVWFQNRRAKFRKQERLAQQKASSSSNQNQSSSNGVTSGSGGGGDQSPNPPSAIKAEGGTVAKCMQKEVKPGSPGHSSSVSTTPNSNTSSLSSHHSSNGLDIKPVNNNGKLSEDSISNNNKWSTSMSPQSCPNAALLVQQANKVLSTQPSHLQSHHAAAAAALSSPFTSLLGTGSAAASYLLGDHLKPTAANHLF